MKLCELCNGKLSHKNSTGVCMKTLECTVENRKRTKAKNAKQRSQYAQSRYNTAEARVKILFSSAKNRAEQQGFPFSITLEDIVIPAICPVLGIEISLEDRNSERIPTLDKIIPELGYVPGNVAVISNRANRLKSDASVAELRAIADWIEHARTSSW